MTITLTQELEQVVKDQLATGQFASAEEVIAMSLRRLKHQYEELKATIAERVAQIERVEFAPLDPRATLAAVRARQQALEVQGNES